MRALAASAALIFAVHSTPQANATPPPQKEPEKKVSIPAEATEGARDLEKTKEPFGKFVSGQPYGKAWKELVVTEPAPKNKKGLGEAETHPDLKRDPIEMQAQTQYLEETDTESKYGFVSIRGVRVFRYGRLAQVQLVIDRIGKEQQKFEADLAALGEGWKDLRAVLALDKKFRVKRNDLAEVVAKKTELKLPLRIVIEPREVPPP